MGRAEIRRFQRGVKKMENKKQLSPEKIYELLADAGYTKHLGGLKATRELADLCNVNRDRYVLEVGCGIGKTACYIAKRYGCRVIGIDICEGMIDRSNERAKREGVADRVEFRVADAQNPPFEDDFFDAVIGEEIATLLDKRRAVSEYMRVTKPGGYIGLNEITWIRTPPPTEMAEYLSRVYGFRGEILTSDGWEELLQDTGLREIVVRTHKVNPLSETLDGFKDLLRAWDRALSLYIRSSAFRRFMKEGLSLSTKKVFEYVGYGIYVGRK